MQNSTFEVDHRGSVVAKPMTRQLSENVDQWGEESFGSLKFDEDFGDWAAFDKALDADNRSSNHSRRNNSSQSLDFSFDSDVEEDEKVVPKLPVSQREIRKGNLYDHQPKIIIETGRIRADDTEQGGDEIGHVVRMNSSLKSMSSSKGRPSSGRRYSNESAEMPSSFRSTGSGSKGRPSSGRRHSNESKTRPSSTRRNLFNETRQNLSPTAPRKDKVTLHGLEDSQRSFQLSKSAMTLELEKLQLSSKSPTADKLKRRKQNLRDLFLKMLEDPALDESITQGETSTEGSSDLMSSGSLLDGFESSLSSSKKRGKRTELRSSGSKSMTRIKDSTVADFEIPRTIKTTNDVFNRRSSRRPSAVYPTYEKSGKEQSKNHDRRSSTNAKNGKPRNSSLDPMRRKSASSMLELRELVSPSRSSEGQAKRSMNDRRASYGLDIDSTNGKSERSRRRASEAIPSGRSKQRQKNRRPSTSPTKSNEDIDEVPYSPLSNERRKLKSRSSGVIRDEAYQKADPIMMSRSFSLNKSWHSANAFADEEVEKPFKATRRRSSSTGTDPKKSGNTRRGTRPASHRSKKKDSTPSNDAPDDIDEDDWAAIILAADAYGMDTSHHQSQQNESQTEHLRASLKSPRRRSSSGNVFELSSPCGNRRGTRPSSSRRIKKDEAMAL